MTVAAAAVTTLAPIRDVYCGPVLHTCDLERLSKNAEIVATSRGALPAMRSPAFAFRASLGGTGDVTSRAVSKDRFRRKSRQGDRLRSRSDRGLKPLQRTTGMSKLNLGTAAIG
jgi:hypothetical protein